MDSYSIQKVICICVVLIVMSIGGCSGYTSYSNNLTIKAMVEAGANPIDAGCAVSGISIDSAPCVSRAALTGS